MNDTKLKLIAYALLSKSSPLQSAARQIAQRSLEWQGLVRLVELMDELQGQTPTETSAQLIASTPCALAPALYIPIRIASKANAPLPTPKKTRLLEAAKRTGPFQLKLMSVYLNAPIPALTLSEFVALVHKARESLYEKHAALGVCFSLGLHEHIHPSADDLSAFNQLQMGDALSPYVTSLQIDSLYRVLGGVIDKSRFGAYPLPLQALLLRSPSYMNALSDGDRDEHWRAFAQALKSAPTAYANFLDRCALYLPSRYEEVDGEAAMAMFGLVPSLTGALRQTALKALADKSAPIELRAKAWGALSAREKVDGKDITKWLSDKGDLDGLDGGTLAALALRAPESVSKDALKSACKGLSVGDAMLFAERSSLMLKNHKRLGDKALFAELASAVIARLLDAPELADMALRYASTLVKAKVPIAEEAMDALSARCSPGALYERGIRPFPKKDKDAACVPHLSAWFVLDADYPPEQALEALDKKSGVTVLDIRALPRVERLAEKFAGKDEWIARLTNPHLALACIVAIGASLQTETLSVLSERIATQLDTPEYLDWLVDTLIKVVPHKGVDQVVPILKRVLKPSQVDMLFELASDLPASFARKVQSEFAEHAPFLRDKSLRLMGAFAERVARLSEREAEALGSYILQSVEDVRWLASRLSLARRAPRLSPAAEVLFDALEGALAYLSESRKTSQSIRPPAYRQTAARHRTRAP